MSSASKPLGVAHFGLGRAGMIHFNNLLANRRIDLIWVVEQNTEHAKTELEQQGATETKVASLEEIDKVLADKNVEAVVVCTPTDTHVPLSIRALKAGKHVFCEKPISDDAPAITEAFQVAEQAGKVLFAAFNRKFDASYRHLYDKVQAGDIGNLQMIRTTFRDTPLWLGAKTFTQTFLCHDIDILCWFAGGPPESVVCMASANIKEVEDNKDVDCIVATLKFPNGVIGILDFARCSCYGYDIRLEVFGSKGMLKMEPRLQTDVYSYCAPGKKDPPFCVSFFDRFKEAYVAELNHFINVIRGKAELLVPRDHSERIGKVCSALEESFKSGQVVKLK